MNSEILLEVNGIRYTGFTDISINKAIDTLSGSFEFKATSSIDNRFPIQVDQKCKIFINNTSVINGYIDIINVDYDAGSHEITISGRDKVSDLVDSTLGEEIDFSGVTTLEQITKKVLVNLNITDIKVIANETIAPFKRGEIETAETGTTAFDFLEKYAKKRQVLLTSDGDGNIVFTKSKDIVLKTILTSLRDSRSTVINARVTFDNTNRFNKYIGLSQINNSGIDFEWQKNIKDSVNVRAESTDSEIRSSRIYRFITEQASDNDNVQKRVIWEANFRRSQAFKYTVIVQGFNAIDDNLLWQPNYLVKVRDEFANINSTLLISKITYSQNLSDGSRTTLELVTKDSFKLLTEKPEKESKQLQEGEPDFKRK